MVLAGASWAQTSPSIGISGSYRVGPGDLLQVTVFEVDELSGPVTVGPRGRITLPLLEAIAVEGKTTLEIEQLLKKLYSENLLKDPQISVTVEEFRSQPISVIGAVNKPGVYQLQGRRRLLEVLAMAGGLAPQVGETIAILRRPGLSAEQAEARLQASLLQDSLEGSGNSLEPVAAEGAEVTEVSVKRLLMTAGGGEANPYVRSHDVVRVAKAGIVYVLGAVVKPGGFPIQDQEQITVLRAVSLAAGLDRHAAAQKARIIREVAGVKTEIPVRVKDVLEGKGPDPVLQAQDILFIPDSSAKSALARGAEAALQMATGVVIFRR